MLGERGKQINVEVKINAIKPDTLRAHLKNPYTDMETNTED